MRTLDVSVINALLHADAAFRRIGIEKGLTVYLPYSDLCTIKESLGRELVGMVVTTKTELPANCEIVIAGIRFEYLQRRP